MAGSGALTIDWGDGTDKETHTLLEHNSDWSDREWNDQFAYTHAYSDASSYTIIIAGINITHLKCSGNELTCLDVGQNAALTNLDCWCNQLTSLDVSQTPSLIQLSCAFNQLTGLDVSKNTALIQLSCAFNQLTSLDMSKNTALIHLDCDRNLLTAQALNTLFGTLHDTPRTKTVSIGDNPGTVDCNKRIAEKKKWTLLNLID